MEQDKPTNRGRWAPGTSGNPKGRPRSGLALAEHIRAVLSPEDFYTKVTQALDDERIHPERRLAFAMQLAQLGYSRPAQKLEHEVKPPTVDEDDDTDGATIEQLTELVALADRRAEILAAIRAQRSEHESSVTDGEPHRISAPLDAGESPVATRAITAGYAQDDATTALTVDE